MNTSVSYSKPDVVTITNFIYRHTGQKTEMKFSPGYGDTGFEIAVVFPGVKEVKPANKRAAFESALWQQMTSLYTVALDCLEFTQQIESLAHWRFVASGAVLAFWHVVPTQVEPMEQALKFILEDGSYLYGHYGARFSGRGDAVRVYAHRAWLPFASEQFKSALSSNPDANWVLIELPDQEIKIRDFSPFELKIQ